MLIAALVGVTMGLRFSLSLNISISINAISISIVDISGLRLIVFKRTHVMHAHIVT
jgi:hypothetical protein